MALQDFDCTKAALKHSKGTLVINGMKYKILLHLYLLKAICDRSAFPLKAYNLNGGNNVLVRSSSLNPSLKLNILKLNKSDMKHS